MLLVDLNIERIIDLVHTNLWTNQSLGEQILDVLVANQRIADKGERRAQTHTHTHTCVYTHSETG